MADITHIYIRMAKRTAKQIECGRPVPTWPRERVPVIYIHIDA